MSRSSDASRRVPSKIQLIAMQPMAAPPVQNSVLSDRVAETNKINKEVFLKDFECLWRTVWPAKGTEEYPVSCNQFLVGS